MTFGDPRIRVHYYKTEFNFGDQLNLELFRYFGERIVSACPVYAQVMAIGSLLQELLPIPGRIRTSVPIEIFGSGFLFPVEGRFIRPVRIHALRGRLSLECCRRILRQPLSDVVLGDPGLLIRRMFPDATRKVKRHDVGVVCHIGDRGSPALERLKLRDRSVTMIDIRSDVKDFVHQIASCRFVLSSAMHGLICADSLGVPNRRIVLGDMGMHAAGFDFPDMDAACLFKFEDYYSALGDVCSRDPIDLRRDDVCDEDIDKMAEEYSVRMDDVERIDDALEEAWRQMRAHLSQGRRKR